MAKEKDKDPKITNGVIPKAFDANGDPLRLIGTEDAIKQACSYLEANPEKMNAAVYAGRITLFDRRAGSVGIFIELDVGKGKGK